MKIKHVSLGLVLFILAIANMYQGALAQKNEIIRKHLDSIGSAEARSVIKDMTVVGSLRYNVLRSGGTGGDGKAVLASDQSRFLVGMSLGIPLYSGENIVFDGKKQRVNFVNSNVRSYLGDFLYRYPDVISRTLLGGSLTGAWLMYDPGFRNCKIEFDGTKKIDGAEVYAMSVLPKGGSDLEIQIFFDKETYRHVRTTYKRTIGALQGATVDTSSQRRGQRQIMTEDFGDFRNEQGLMLPHSYKIYVLYDGETETKEYEWVMKFNQFLFNQNFEPGIFEIK